MTSFRILALACALAFSLGLGRAAAQGSDPLKSDAGDALLDSRVMSLGGALKAAGLWRDYKKLFVTDDGRVVDTANSHMSHSEGQGYAMLLAVAANDRRVFDLLWNWTRANLMVRDDQLLAWRWEPQRRPAVGDMNDASDGDILVAWALTEAAEWWKDVAYKVAARRIAVEVSRKLVLFKTKLGALLLPAVSGFHAEDRADGPIINLSYYIFPAFARLDTVAPEVDWAGLAQTGLNLLETTRTTPRTLPPDWLALEAWKARPADGFAPLFAYNAVRIPLYLAWAGFGERRDYAPFIAWAARARGRPAMVDATSGADTGEFGGSGAAAIAALIECAWEGARFPADLATVGTNQDYYPATLHMLAIVAAEMRYSSCLPK